MMWDANGNAFDPAKATGHFNPEPPPTGSPEWQAIQLLHRNARTDERLGEQAVAAERDGDEQGAWLAMATRAEYRRFSERLRRDLASMWQSRLYRHRQAWKALHRLAADGIWGTALDCGKEGTMMEAANRIADPIKPMMDMALDGGHKITFRAYPKARHLRLHVDGCAFPQDWHTRGLESTKHEAPDKTNPSPGSSGT